MSLFYLVVFAVLLLEIAAITLLLGPFSINARLKMWRLFVTAKIPEKFSSWIAVLFLFIAALFLDSIMAIAKDDPNNRAHLWYSQRNFYLTGFTLFLSLVLFQLHSVIKISINALDDLQEAKRVASDATKQKASLETSINQDYSAKIRDLEAQVSDLEKQVLDKQILKKQAEQQHQEYMRLADEYNKLEQKNRDPSNKKDK